MAPHVKLLWWLLPCAFALLAHQPVLDNDFVNWDDPQYILHNPQVDAPLDGGVIALLRTRLFNYPIPVTLLGFAGQKALFGPSPRGFHGVSIALHLIVTLLAMALARRLGAPLWSAALAASLFAAHPLTAETVSWAIGQKDLWMALFALAALAIRSGARGDSAGASVATAACATLAILGKPSAMPIAIALAVLDRALGRSLRRPAALATYALPAAMALVSGLSVLFAHGFMAGEAPKPFGLHSLLEAAWAFFLSACHVVYPHELLVRYFAPTGLVLGLCAAAGLLAFVGFAAGTFRLWQKGERLLAFTLLAAFLFYAPVSGILPSTRGTADSYLYLPLSLLVASGALALGRLSVVRHHRIAQVLLLCGATVFAIRCRAENRDWQNSVTLWSDLAFAYPKEPRALMRVADAFAYEGQPDRALALYESLRTEHPAFAPPRLSHARLLEGLGRFAEAERLYGEAARLGDEREYREAYAFFMLDQEALSPSDMSMFRRSLVELAPDLAERGKRQTTVERAARRLRALGENALAERLEARARTLQTAKMPQ